MELQEKKMYKMIDIKINEISQPSKFTVFFFIYLETEMKREREGEEKESQSEK